MSINFLFNKREGSYKNKSFPLFLSVDELKRVKNFHETIETYGPTPLVKLDNLAGELGIEGIYVKNESKRMGLNSFKVLGGSYAVAKILCEKLGIDIGKTTFGYLKSEEVRKIIGQVTFSTCSDGNHGRAVAWTARELRQKAVIYMPKGTARRRVEAIEELGAKVIVTDVNYDDTVRLAKEEAEKNGWEIVQDTSWEGYKRVPEWIMQGYAGMAQEAVEQLENYGINRPTHIFIQAGVGAMAGGCLGFIVNYYGGEHPTILIMEPTNAACMYKSAEAGDGKPHAVTGDMETIMAGLACGEPITAGWEILRDFADAFCACPDFVTARGMRILANPIGDDEAVVSGESGAIGTGLISLMMQRKEYKDVRERLGLDENSVVLLFSTEGDTDPVNYRRVLWDGAYPVPEN